MRKVLSLVLVLTLVLGSFSMAFAASYSDIAGHKCEEAVTVLSDLGVISGYEDGTYQPDKDVTRAEAAKLIVEALGVGDMAQGTTTRFTDMAGSGWAIGYVGYAESLGVLKGYEDGSYRPLNPVSYQEWATILVRALGYTDESLPGTWPANYVSKAQGLGIFDDVVKSSGNASRGDVAIMLYNTIDLKIGTVNKDGEWVANSGKTITLADGTKVDQGDRLIFKLGADAATDAVITGDESSAIDLGKYVGAYGTKYTKSGKILAIGEVKSEFIKGKVNDKNVFEGDDDVDYTGMPVLPTAPASSAPQADKDAYKAAAGELDKTVKFFINGKTTSAETFCDAYAVGNKITIAAKVSGKSLSNVYSIMSWKATNHGQVDSDDLKSITEDKELLDSDLPTLRDGSIDVTKLQILGVASLDKIAVDNIVAVYANNSDVITRIEVGTEVVTGEVTSMSGNLTGDLSKVKYTINGKEYKISGLNGYNAAGGFDVGDEIKAYLDYDGKIYEYEATSEDALNYAVVIGAPTQDGAFGDHKVKLVTAKGDETIFSLKSADVGTGITDNMLVSYKVNSSGKITELKKATGTFSASSTLSKKGVIDGKLVVDGVVVFSKKADASEACGFKYSISSASNVADDKPVGSGNTYALNSKDKIAAMVVDSSAAGAKDSYGFVSSYSTIKNSDGDKVYSVKVVIAGAEKTYNTTDTSDSYNFDKTGLMEFSFDGEEIDSIQYADVSATAEVIDPNLADGKVLAFSTTRAGQYVDLGNVEAYKIEKVDGERLLIGTGTTGKYEVVSDAVVYAPTLDADNNTINGWKTSSVSSLSKDGYVVLFQTDDDSDNWDTVVYVRSGDVSKLESSMGLTIATHS